MRRSRQVAALAALVLLVAACTSTDPTPPASVATSAVEPSMPVPTPTPTPEPTRPPEVEVPLAVVTGYTSVVASITAAEVETALDDDTIIQACELFTAINPVPRCLPAVEIVAHLVDNPADLALLPAGLVVPTIKVLPVDGADLFGNAEARAVPYPFKTTIEGPPEGWSHDSAEIRTLMSLGDSCPDRGVAFAAITQGRGWDWVFGGGTAEYTAVYPNPVPEGFVGNGFNIVDAVPTGNEGAVADLVSGADVTLDDFECPVVDDFVVNEGTLFSIDPAVLPQLRDTYGVDVASLAANHLFDRGQAGFVSTLEKFGEAGIPVTGAGLDLDAALEPALVDVNGLT
ncbi:MAG: CapA family protein, partial [Candidatus Limnocylindria bacterium]